MTILESKADRSTIRRVSLATGIGAVFGFQAWRLAVSGFPVPMAWSVALWVFLRHVALGFAVGTIRRPKSWWARGLGLGALFSVPSTVALSVKDPLRVPLALAICAGSMAAGVLIALLTDCICPRTPAPSVDLDSAAEPPRAFEDSGVRPRPANANARRLADAKNRLERLDAERELRHNPAYCQTAEDRIVWRELLELELQDIDDRVGRLRGGKPQR